MNDEECNADEPNAPSRAEQIRRLVHECLTALSSSESISLKEMIQAHPELMPELGAELAKVEYILDAGGAPQQSGASGGSLNQTAKFREDSAHGLHIRCPNCRNGIELVVDTPFTDITCVACGSTFSLVGQETETRHATPIESIGHFELVSRLGLGSFGTVWKAHDAELDRTVAVKIPREGQLDPIQEEQFFREARVAAQLKHPNIVAIHEVGRENGTLYIVSDFIRGVPLSDWLTTRRPSHRESAELCATIAAALHHAHEAGIIHRDLKPSNIMMDGDEEPHIMDFGLAKRDAGEISMTIHGQILGTPAYMSPEQARGEGHASDRRSDIYSIGVLFFELLTGERPFRGNPRTLIYQVIHDEPPSPRKMDQRIPRDLETICLKCLEKDPRNRYQTAQDIVDEIRRFLAGEPIQARPLGHLALAGRWCKRNPAAAVLVGFVAAIAILAPLAAVRQSMLKRQAGWEAKRATAAAADAEKSRQQAVLQRDRAAASEKNARQLLYDADMNLAQAALERTNLTRTVQLLNDHRDEDSRSFEWHYLWHRTHQFERVLTGHTGRVFAAAASPDGLFLASGGQDHRLILWNIETGELLNELEMPRSVLSAIAFSKDGHSIAIGEQSGKIHLWDWRGQTPLKKVGQHGQTVLAIYFSDDDKRLVSTSSDKTAAIWNVLTGQREQTLEHHGYVTSAAFAENDSQVITGCRDAAIRVWDVETGELEKVLEQNTQDAERINCVIVSGDGKKVYAGDDNGRVRVRDLQTGKLLATLHEHGDDVTSLVETRDGSLLLSGSLDGTIKLWRPDEETAVRTLKAHTAGVRALTLVGDRDRFVSVGDDGTAKVWSVFQVTQWESIAAHRLMNNVVRFAPDGATFLTFGKESSQTPDRDEEWTIKLWDTHTGMLVRLVARQRWPILAAATSPNGKLAAVASASNKVLVIRTPGGELVAEFEGHTSMIASVAFRDDQHLVSASFDGTVRVWDLSAQHESRRLSPTGPDPNLMFKSITSSHDGRLIAAGTLSGTNYVWNVDQGTCQDFTPPQRGQIETLCFSPAKGILSSVAGTDITVWSIDQGAMVAQLKEHSDVVTSLAFSHDGKRLASGGRDGILVLWDRHTWKPTLSLNLGPNGEIASLDFAPDDAALLVGLMDGRVQVLRSDAVFR